MALMQFRVPLEFDSLSRLIIAKYASFLKYGNLIGFPTATVYTFLYTVLSILLFVVYACYCIFIAAMLNSKLVTIGDKKYRQKTRELSDLHLHRQR